MIGKRKARKSLNKFIFFPHPKNISGLYISKIVRPGEALNDVQICVAGGWTALLARSYALENFPPQSAFVHYCCSLFADSAACGWPWTLIIFHGSSNVRTRIYFTAHLPFPSRASAIAYFSVPQRALIFQEDELDIFSSIEQWEKETKRAQRERK